MAGKIHPTDLTERDEAVGCKVGVTILGTKLSVDKKIFPWQIKGGEK